VCLPSRNEPFGIVVLEAWSAGKPVIASQNGGMSEYVQHEVNGLKIYPAPDSVAWGVSRTFSDFDRARWMGRNGRQAVEERFTWDMIADQTLAVYGELCPRHASRPQQVDGRMAPTTSVAASCDTSQDGTCEAGSTETARGETIDALLHVKDRLQFGTGGLAPGTDDALTASRLSLVRSGRQPRRQGRALVGEGDGEPVFPGEHTLSPYGCHESTDAHEPDGQPQTPCRRPGTPSRHHHSLRPAQAPGPRNGPRKEMITSEQGSRR